MGLSLWEVVIISASILYKSVIMIVTELTDSVLSIVSHIIKI